ncbi:hypothetical protein [Nocardia mexicana]|uniref:Uncharacterized protein n=1 Tax=Nocardia mexicana TaxID=279262 RepID=A0A370HAP6_9NOCA|nr:hypothetical protein [Nocardia mexicana]RDI54016.1 hypothetical protein DFR68_102137 [Nocardia mexicana]
MPSEPSNQKQPHPWPWERESGIPKGDDAVITRHLANSAVKKLTTALRDIVVATEIHEDMTPRSAAKMWELTNIMSGELVAWVRRWPR